ncbi:MAG TPA: succinate dehydrogenase iron-sulfur subunit [Spirochaetia bacterium]|nr:succinate dehydrogenase iron-sulfur subunit [Spirochaetia bacterium]
MKVLLEIQRQSPEKGSQPHFQTYEVEVERTDRILDALLHVNRNLDGSLVFRRSCAHGVCGSDAVRINGKEHLACKTLFKDVVENDGDTVRIEPLRHLPVQRDLMVDQTIFFDKFRRVKPFLLPKEEAPAGKEYYQSQEDRELFDDATKCINCGSCYSACPVLDTNPEFIGPAAIVQASRFLNDSRDKGLEERIAILDQPNGVWACENHFECTKACPREIKVTKLINLTKRQIKKYREARGEKTAEPPKQA